MNKVDILRLKIARFFAPSHYEELDHRVNQRIASMLLKTDPFELIMKEYHGIFSEEFEHPEDNLNTQGKIGMRLWAYGQVHDPHFNHMIAWVMNSQGNETLKRAPVTTERIMYGRAQISTALSLKKEIGRLSLAYEELLEKQKNGEDFESETSVE